MVKAKSIFQKKGIWLTELLAHFLNRLKSVKNLDGSSLFDHTTLTFWKLKY